MFTVFTRAKQIFQGHISDNRSELLSKKYGENYHTFISHFTIKKGFKYNLII